MNYVVTGPEQAPAVLLIPGQTESWWGDEKVMPLLEKYFRRYAVDLRGRVDQAARPDAGVSDMDTDFHSCSDLRPEPHRRLRTTRYQPHSCFRQKPKKQQLWQSLLNEPIDRAVLF